MAGKTSGKSTKAAAKAASKRPGAEAASKRTASKRTGAKPAGAKTVLLSGGNPQIEKADGDAPVQAYIAALNPVPPGSGKDRDSRWIDIYEGELDVEQMARWIRQAASIPGWRGF